MATLSDPSGWVDLHGDYLFRYALMRLRDRSLAEEAVQETFLAALKSKNNFAGQSSERTWLVGILKHKIIDFYRKQSRELPMEEYQLNSDEDQAFRTSGEWVGHWTEEAAPADWGRNPIAAIEKREFREVLEQCLAALPPRLAQVFIMREVSEMSSEEICGILEISESNLWVMLHRARQQLRRQLEQTYFAPKEPQRLNSKILPA